MAHEVESMFFAGETPWHGLGRNLAGNPGVEEALVAAGLDWRVDLRPLCTQGENPIGVPAFATVRNTDNAVLGVVGPTYKPVQNKDAFEWFRPWVESGEVALETAGSLRGGKRIWALARVKRDPIEIVPGDEIRNYVLLSNGHDGTLALRAGFSAIRVVCANTMAAAHGDEASRLLRVRHTAAATKTLDAIRDAMDLATREFRINADVFKTLAQKSISSADLATYVAKVFETPEETNARTLDKVIPLFENGRGNDLPGVKGTFWAAYNAVNEYLAYERGRNADNRLNSMWFGSAANINARALNLAARMAA